MDFNGYLLLGLIGVVTFVLNHRIRFPGGHMLFGMVISGSIHLFIYPFGDTDGIVKLIAIVFLSVSIGSKITLETILLLRKVILPAGCIIITLVTLGLVLGVLLHKLTAIDLNTALLSSVPGGAASLTAIADELGADMRIVGFSPPLPAHFAGGSDSAAVFLVQPQENGVDRKLEKEEA